MTDDIDGQKMPPARRANRDQAFEVAFGQRVKAMRLAARMSQTALGEAIGVSFQQVQKYEVGKDRVSVSTLQAIAKAFGVHPGSFFDDEGLASSVSLKDMREARRISERITQMNDPLLVRRLLALVDALADAKGTRTNGATKGDGHLPTHDDPETTN